MATSPPASPPSGNSMQRPMSAMIHPTTTRPRSQSRISASSRHGVSGGTRYSDEDAGGKTAVKVAVRVRPPLKPDDPGYDLIPQRFRGATCQVTTPTSLSVESAQGKKLFVFDRVFGEDIDQEGVWEYLRESVDCFMQGYNVSILAYGQSGAGKSYTMGTTGPSEQGNARLMGVVPRAASALFEKLSPSSKSGIRSPNRYSMNAMSALSSYSKNHEKTWKMTATYVEIYQEQLHDLLLDESVPMNERPQVSIREDTKGRILLTGLKQIPINSVEDLLNALNHGSSIRQTDATAVNARSSRSHAVFSLNLVQRKGQAPTAIKEKRRSVPLEALSGSENWITVDSKLHFVDLAGSERLKNTGADGQRAKEGISINAGLASLGKVISQLSSRHAGSHVSYRDSRLTRLLQDSLGGNAITYMVACVNPAEFHLSETLNTVQYAQRARAIQIKPQIQQIHDDSDKQAVIDRLRAEVSFLRDQIRLSERAERRTNAPQERSERQHEREIDLQNQLLDIQENYNALSQRHAKIITEIAKAREDDSADTPALKDAIGNSALERLKRSNSFAEAVEQVVLEYEKTIQTLEASLSNTRGSLSSSESTLLERETKIAYMETVNQQLQARLQKAMDRETNDDNYLRDLESRVAGASTDEEKSTALVTSLRNELSRVRESEAGAEDYISTLEERLAEAEQQHEIMSREIERLEHVVDRQRSINKLDNLLYELDHIRNDKPKDAPAVNGHAKVDSDSFHSFTGTEHTEGTFEGSPVTSRAGTDDHIDVIGGAVKELDESDPRTPVPIHVNNLRPHNVDEPTSPAQSQFVNDKLETVTQELFDLRVEHESTVTDYDELQRKYQVALQTLAELQDTVEETRRGNLSRPVSFAKTDDGHPVASRTLSSELSSVGELPHAADSSELEVKEKEVDTSLGSINKDQVVEEMEKLRALNNEKEKRMAELSENHSQLQERHQDTLEYVEELKAEVHKASMPGRSSPNPSILRRKAERTSVISDRANRSFAILRNMVLENFEDQPDKVQGFETNLSTAMSEFQIRSGRVIQLEAELSSLRKEMEAKMAIISGLTRERSSLAASPLDMSAIATIQEQLMESENKIRQLSETHAQREKDLLDQVDHLKSSLGSTETPRSSVPGSFPESSVGSVRESRGDSLSGDHHEHQVVKLQKEVADWRSKHDSAMESMKASEKHLLATINDLQVNLQNVEQQSRSVSPEETSEAHDTGKKRHEETVTVLQKELETHKATAADNAKRLADLEQSYNKILTQVEDDARSKELTEKELETHRGLVANLESQLEAHKASIASHQEGLDGLKESHSKEIDELTAETLKLQAESNDKLAAALAEHKKASEALQAELEQSRASTVESTSSLEAEVAKSKELMKGLLTDAAMILNKPTNADNLTAHLQSLVNARKDIGALHETATSELNDVRRELETFKSSATVNEQKYEELKQLTDVTTRELELIKEKEQKSSRLVEELEEQLNSNFDQTQAANHRLSALQSERQVQISEVLEQKAEIEKDLDESKNRIAQLEAELSSMGHGSYRESVDPRDGEMHRSNSANGTKDPRKSVPAANLPSPPPAIPLPPLPGNPSGGSNGPSPPTSRHQSKDIATTQALEDQEARIRTIEKHLFAEKQLTATLEEALTDLESSSTKMKSEMEAWRRKCSALEDELQQLRKEKQNFRLSVQHAEEEGRRRLEQDRLKLEERMKQLTSMTNKKNKKSSLNCF